MEIRHLHYFMAVCEELHFTKAAEKLGISQPTLSQQIRVLEDELGMPLFDRIGKKIVVTEAGSLLFSYATEMLTTLQNVKDAINDLQELQRGQISVGIMPSDLDYRITQLVIDFHQKFPKVKLMILASIDIMRQVLENEVDIGIGTNVEPDDRLVIIPLRREEYVLTVSQEHPLANQTAITIAELKGLPMVMYPEGFFGREIVEEAVKKHGFQLHSILETSSVTSIMNLVRANIGATVQPYHLIQQINDPTLCSIRISDGAPSRSLSIIYRVDRYVSQATTAFIKQIKEYFKA
ncbi:MULTISPECIES: LysR substrate-binding domain-containing protein [Lysinibacillus]|uniref:LysR family transcriptional regulator n=1 Tax=Lysinibacillus fusiformis TaxID=28031 RepID=A0A2I0V3C0_9BACI|nr:MULTISPECIES: LysR substrate-binding domain-containing protein [Lysinibacillus]MEE3809046.1 LysR substrate-binding domain-containing protein [Lysinibacillus fusiformis]PKU52807.1 LysR family transcriptional regulator [Lysinibacillus fusiformis]